jgi:hypothetical protein
MRNRYFRGGITAAGSTARATAKVGRILWYQVFGVVCALFSIEFGDQLWKAYQRRATLENANAMMGALALVLLIFLWFTVTSFWRARRIKRS